MVHVTAGHILRDWKRFGLSHRCESLRLWPVCTRSVWYWWGQDLQTYKIAPLVSFVVGFFPCSCYSCTSDCWMILASRQAGKLMFIDFFVISVALFCFQRTFWHCSPMTTWVAVTARAHDWTWRTIHRSDFTILLIKGLMHHTSRLFITCCYLVNFFVVTSLSIPHQQAAEWVSNQFQMCITNLRIVRDRKKDITGGGKRLILTPRGFEKKSSLKSACAQSREISARAGLDPQWGPSQNRAQCHHHCQDFPQNKARQWHKELPRTVSRVGGWKVCIWFSEQLRRSLVQELEFIGPFHGFNGIGTGTNNQHYDVRWCHGQ